MFVLLPTVFLLEAISRGFYARRVLKNNDAQIHETSHFLLRSLAKADEEARDFMLS
jgi:hypothetical protein